MAFGIGFVRYKQIGAQLDQANKQIRAASDTAITLTVDRKRRDALIGKINMAETKLKELRKQIDAGEISK